MRAKRRILCLLRVLLFALLLTALFRFAGRLLSGGTEDPLNHAGEGMYQQLPGTVEAVFVGPSHVYSSVIPQRIYDQTGITAYNFSSSAQSFRSTYWAMVEAIRVQHPKAVFVDLCVATADDSTRQAASYYTALERMLTPFSLTKWQAFFDLRASEQRNLQQATVFTDTSAHEIDWTDYFRLTAFHTQRTINRESFAFACGQDFYSYSRGYNPRFSTVDVSSFVQKSADGAALSEENAATLQDMIRYAKKTGTQLVFTVMPYYATERDLAILAQAEQLAEESGAAVLDFNTLNITEKPADFADLSHTNYSGACKISDYLAGWLQQNLTDAQDHRGGWLYRSWDAAAGCYDSWQIAMGLLPAETDAQAYCRQAAQLDSEYLVLAVQAGTGTGALSAAQTAQLAALGLAPAAGTQGYSAALCGGKLYREGGEDLAASLWSYKLLLDGQENGALTSIDRWNCTAQGSGIQITVLDRRTGSICDSVLLGEDGSVQHLVPVETD